jgi:hypothetical protein
MEMESKKPRLSLLDRLRGRTVGMIELEAAAAQGEAEMQCEANWITGGESYGTERCPAQADRLIEADTPLGELKMGVCEQHEYLLQYVDGSTPDLGELYDVDEVLAAFPPGKRSLAQASIEEAIGRPFSNWVAEAKERRAADAADDLHAEYHQVKRRRDEERSRQRGLDI